MMKALKIHPPQVGEDSDCRRGNEPYKHRWGATKLHLLFTIVAE